MTEAIYLILKLNKFVYCKFCIQSSRKKILASVVPVFLRAMTKITLSSGAPG